MDGPIKLYGLRSKATGNLLVKGYRGRIVELGAMDQLGSWAIYGKVTGAVKGLATKHGAEVVELTLQMTAVIA